MKLKFKYSFWGYDPNWVERKINGINSMYEEKVEKLENELSIINSEIDTVRKKISRAQSRLENQESYQQKVSKVLYNAHLESTKKVHNTLEKINNLKKEKADMVSNTQQELTRLNKVIKTLVSEIQSKVKKYKYQLEEAEYDKTSGDSS